MNIVVGIPARFASTRFPGKLLAPLAGKPVILHVVERALAADIGPVLVATDDTRIADAVARSGVEICMTRMEHKSGTERLAEAMQNIPCDIVVNVQGDEPLIDPQAIRAVIHPLQEEKDLPMATLAHPIHSTKDLNDSHIVKLICNADGHAMYFSRSPIPYSTTSEINNALQHIGLYAYRKSFLLRYPSLPPCPSEKIEKLEQLRVLHHGYNIAVTVGAFTCIGIDTPEDLARAETLLSQGQNKQAITDFEKINLASKIV